ncbi:MAG: antitoxin Xre/MbcA/ParS toxin-binding domain-containing protein [Chitinophagaceae bacterium]
MSKIMQNHTLEQKLDSEVAVLISNTVFYSKGQAKKIRFAELFDNKFLLISLINNGIPYSFFSLIQTYTPLEEKDWTSILDLTSKSLQRYKAGSKQFGPLQSEKIIEMAEVTNIGLEVFRDMEKFSLWLDTPSFALGKMKPKDLLKDSYGKELVLGELVRINYGIFA